MKKFLMIAAVAASVMMVSCDKKAGNATEASVTEEVAVGPVEMKLSSVSGSGDFYKQFTPGLSDFAFEVKGAEGDSVAVEATVAMKASEAKEVKALKSAGVQLSYMMTKDAAIADVNSVLQLDPSQYEGAVALAKAGLQDVYKPFKFVGKIGKADLDSLKNAKNVFLNMKKVVFE